MSSKGFKDARIEELRLLTELARVAGIMIEGLHENTPYRRMIVHLLHEGLVNGVTNDISKRGPDYIKQAVDKDVWNAIAAALGGQRVNLQISHKGSVRRAELERALMTSRSMEPFGILLDGRYWERDLTIRLAALGRPARELPLGKQRGQWWGAPASTASRRSSCPCGGSCSPP